MLNDKETVQIVRKASGGINDPHPLALSFIALNRTWHIRCLVFNTRGKTSVCSTHFVAMRVRMRLLLSTEECN